MKIIIYTIKKREFNSSQLTTKVSHSSPTASNSDPLLVVDL